MGSGDWSEEAGSVGEPYPTPVTNTGLTLERFSIECRKTKTKLIALTNHEGHRQYVNQSKLEASACGRCEARENQCE